MTTVDVVFKYGLPPGDNEMRAISDAREVYGIRKLTFNEKTHETDMGEFWGQMVKDDRYPFAIMKDPKYLSQGPYTN